MQKQASDRPAGSASASEEQTNIELTPEMIEAGVRALFPAEIQAHMDEAEVVARIFRAMDCARRQQKEAGG